MADGEETRQGLDPLNPDSDGDGLDDRAELRAGTDPLARDSDGDGLEDGEEATLGTDPLNEDSDGDGLLDSEDPDTEFGVSPYTGGWPSQTAAKKRRLEADGVESVEQRVGDRVPRVRLVDQFGDVVDLYDFAGHGRYVVLQAHATWAPPSVFFAEWWSHQSNDEDMEHLEGVREAVDDGRLFLVQLLSGDDNDAATPDEVAGWAADYPHERVPVLAMSDPRLKDLFTVDGAFGVPATVLVDEDMQVVGGNPPRGTILGGAAWERLEELFPAR